MSFGLGPVYLFVASCGPANKLLYKVYKFTAKEPLSSMARLLGIGGCIKPALGACDDVWCPSRGGY